MHERLTSEAQILVCFAVQPLLFEIQGCRKSEIHWMTQTELKYLTVQSTLYTEYLPQKPTFWSVSLLWLAVSEIQHAQGWWNSEMHRMKSAWIFGSESVICTFRGDVVWFFFLPYGHMLRETNKSKMQNFEKQTNKNKKKRYGDMVKRYLCTVSCLTGSEKMGFTDGRTTDARVTTVAKQD